jgi:Sel1 repeat
MFPAVSFSPSPTDVFLTDKQSVFGLFKRRWLRIACVAVSSSVTLPMIGQTARTVTAAHPLSPPAAKIALPQQIVEREGAGCGVSGTDYSIVWRFDGLKGTGKFDISRQQMDIDSFDGHTLVVRRTSYSGGQVGSGTINGTAVYTGHIEGTHITGTASYHPGGGPVTDGPWCGEVENPRVLMPETLAANQPIKGIPPYILECELDQYCDGLWNLNGSAGKAVWPRNPNVLADLTVESFNPDNIVIRRTDTSSSITVVYKGRVNGNRISGTAEAHAGDKSATYNWTAIIPATSCTRSDGLKPDTQESAEVGKTALRFNLLPAALDCYLIAAKNGDADAQNMVAALYYQGGNSPIKQDYAQAFYWVGKSAAQGDYAGEFSLGKMYQRGRGTQVDPVKAQYWFDQAAATPVGRAIAANKARAAQNQALAGFVFDIITGAIDSGDGSSSRRTVGGDMCRNLHSSDTHYTYCPD